jgi:hypothetical protein
LRRPPLEVCGLTFRLWGGAGARFANSLIRPFVNGVKDARVAIPAPLYIAAGLRGNASARTEIDLERAVLDETCGDAVAISPFERRIPDRLLSMAGSTDRRNTFCELLSWGLKEQGLSWFFIEPPGDRAGLGLGMQ